MDAQFNEKSISAVAKFFKVSQRTVSAWLADGCPGESGRFPLPQMVEWVKANRWCPSSDPLLTGGDSDNLERYRGARADLAEHDLQDRKETLIHPIAVRDVFLHSLRFYDNCIEQLRERFGDDAANIISEAVEHAEELIKHELGCPPETNGGD